MSTRTRRMVTTARTALAGTIAAAVMTVGLGAASPSGAATTLRYASPSAFCTTIYSYHVKPPTGANYSSYRAWAKANLGFYQKLASEAPNGKAKTALKEIVTILKYEASAKNLKSLGKYVVKNQKSWVNFSKSLASAIINCAKSLA